MGVQSGDSECVCECVCVCAPGPGTALALGGGGDLRTGHCRLLGALSVTPGLRVEHVSISGRSAGSRSV